MPLTKADVLNFGKTLSDTLGSIGSTLLKRRDEIGRDELLERYRSPDAMLRDVNGNPKNPSQVASQVGNDMLYLSKKGFDKEAALLGDMYKQQIDYISQEQKNKAYLQQLRLTNPEVFQGEKRKDGVIPDYFDDYYSGKKFDLRFTDVAPIMQNALINTKEAAKPEKTVKIDRGDKIEVIYPDVIMDDGRPLSYEYDKKEGPARVVKMYTQSEQIGVKETESLTDKERIVTGMHPTKPGFTIDYVVRTDKNGKVTVTPIEESVREDKEGSR